MRPRSLGGSRVKKLSRSMFKGGCVVLGFAQQPNFACNLPGWLRHQLLLVLLLPVLVLLQMLLRVLLLVRLVPLLLVYGVRGARGRETLVFYGVRGATGRETPRILLCPGRSGVRNPPISRCPGRPGARNLRILLCPGRPGARNMEFSRNAFSSKRLPCWSTLRCQEIRFRCRVKPNRRSQTK